MAQQDFDDIEIHLDSIEVSNIGTAQPSDALSNEELKKESK